MNEVLRLRRLRDVRDGLLGIDFEALDAARGLEGVTHAAMRRERGPAPFYDALEASWQPPQGPRLTGGEYLAGRIDDLKALYPSPRAVNSAYSEVLDWVTAITGTTGFAPSRWPQAAIGCAS
jgi:hypothetical protein